MAEVQLARVVQHLRHLLGAKEAATLATDCDLLTRYLRERDELAFEAIVHRYGPMVLGVCQRVLRNSADAEDAFQATFLILVRKAPTLRTPGRVGNWLYGVAYRTALQARDAAVKRRTKEAKAMARVEAPQDVWAELRPVFDQELSRLPEKYRTVVLLADLDGKTREQVAVILGCPPGTVASRLARARAMLAKRLSRHVGSMPAGSLLPLITQKACSPHVPPSLLAATFEAAARFTAGPVALSLISGKVISLTNGVLKAMLLNKLLKATALLLVFGALATGSGLVLATSQTPIITNEEQDESPVQATEHDSVIVHGAEVLSRYEMNEAAADEKFNGKSVRIVVSMSRARIKQLHQPWDNNDWALGVGPSQPPYYVLIMSQFSRSTLRNSPALGSGMHLVFGFSKDAQKQLASLTSENEITIEGQCLGRNTTRNGNEIVCFKDCKIIEVKEEKSGKGNDVGR
jgi:RNA polymerase sigma factor (sigma-70 family)